MLSLSQMRGRVLARGGWSGPLAEEEGEEASCSKEPARLCIPLLLSCEAALERQGWEDSPELVRFRAGPDCPPALSVPPPFSLSFLLEEDRRTSRRSLSLSDRRRLKATAPP